MGEIIDANRLKRRRFPWKIGVRPLFAWYDLWVGVYVDTARRRVFILPVPMFGIVIWWDRLSPTYLPKEKT